MLLIKRIAILGLTFAYLSVANATSTTDEIDQQIWKPFIETWKTMNADKHTKLYHPDFTRVSESMNKVIPAEEYLNSIKRMMGKKGVSSTITFKFRSRIQSDDQAWESGVYKAVMLHPEKGEKVQYADFNVLLQKVDGIWKIKLDHDRPSTQAAFDDLP